MKSINEFNSVKEFIDSLNSDQYNDLVKYLADNDMTIEESYEDSEFVYAWIEYLWLHVYIIVHVQSFHIITIADINNMDALTMNNMKEALIVNYIESYDGDDDQATIEDYSDYIMNLSSDELTEMYNDTFN
jgi:hypothetical protein